MDPVASEGWRSCRVQLSTVAERSLRPCHPRRVERHDGMDVVGALPGHSHTPPPPPPDALCQLAEAPSGKVMQIFAGHAAGSQPYQGEASAS